MKITLLFLTEDLYFQRLRQYRTRISQWGKDKNIKPQEMKAIVRKKQKRNLVEIDKQGLQFSVRGNMVDPSKVNRWMKKNQIPESSLYAPSPAECKMSFTRLYYIQTQTC